MKIAIMGTGGLGGYYGGKLAHANEDVTFIARGENLRALRERGLQVHSPHGDFAVKSVQATDNAGEIGPVDLVLFCVKAYDVESAIGQMQPLVGARTAVIPVLNGIDHIAQLQVVFGESAVLGGMGLISAHKGAPGVIHHVADPGPYQLEFGEWAGEISPRCKQIEALFSQADLRVAAVSNIVHRMWWKLAAICGASVFAALRGSKGMVWTPETQALIRGAVAEAVNVAQANQAPLEDTFPDEVVEMLSNLPPGYKPSLLVDLEHGNWLEVESLSGAVVRMGQEAGIATPVNFFIYACLKPYAKGTPALDRQGA